MQGFHHLNNPNAMAVKIRLQRHGRRKAPFYHIVIADSRSPRDGRFIEKIGTYNPMTKPATIIIDRDAAVNWLNRGAQPTDTANAIMRYKGILYYRHLLAGVTKGAITQEVADERFEKYISAKNATIQNTLIEVKEARKANQTFMFGAPKAKVVIVPEVVEEVVVAEEVAPEVVEEVVVEEAAPVVVEEAAPEVVVADDPEMEIMDAAPAAEVVAEEAAPAAEEAPAAE
jgi:small subunit ribosomal protein S16